MLPGQLKTCVIFAIQQIQHSNLFNTLIGSVLFVSLPVLQLSAFMSGNLDFFAEGAGYRTRGSSIGTEPAFEGPRSHPAVTWFRQTAASYLASLNAGVGSVMVTGFSYRAAVLSAMVTGFRQTAVSLSPGGVQPW